MNRTVKTLMLLVQLLVLLTVVGTAVYHTIQYGVSSYEGIVDHLTSPEGENMVPIILHSMLITLFGIVFYTVFGKATYPEISFIMLAASMSIIIDLRILFILYEKVSTMQLFYCRKLIYFFWLLSASLLFCSGLFHNGVAYLKQNLFILISVCAVTVLIYLAPVMTERSPFSALTSGAPSIVIIIRFLEVTAVLNYVIAAVRNNNRTFYLIAAGLLLFITGNELLTLCCSTSIILAAGAVCMTAGTILMIRKFYLLHLWS